ncbi:MAG: nuclear transport factor 2 family protein [Candidatus Hydrogenedentota bacterium]
MDFEGLLEKFTTAVENADYDGFGELFAEDGVYHDGFYGAFEGRDAIMEMLRDHFHGTGESYKWVMEEPVYLEPMGYARYIFSYDSTIPDCKGKHVVFEGMSQFTIENGQISCYREIFDRGVPLTQLDFPTERIGKSLRRWTDQLLATERGRRM